MRDKHLEDDQIFDCAIDHIEGKAPEIDCTCESCSSRINRARDLAMSLRLAAFEKTDIVSCDFGNIVENHQKRKKVRRKKRIIYSATGLLAAACVAIIINISIGLKQNANLSENGSALVMFSSGDVLINGKQIKPGIFAKSGDIVETKIRSFCVIQFGNSSLVALGENTELTIAKLKINKNKSSIVLNQSAGITFNKVIKSRSDYSVISKSAAVVVSGTSFTFSAKENKSVIKLLHGRVDVSSILGPAGRIVIEQGNSVSVDERGISAIEPLDVPVTKKLLILDAIKMEIDDKRETVLQPEVQKILTEGLNTYKSVTLADIEKKYGVLSRIETWNGKVYIGAFIRQGASARLITPNGEMQISIKDVSKISEYTIKQ